MKSVSCLQLGTTLLVVLAGARTAAAQTMPSALDDFLKKPVLTPGLLWQSEEDIPAATSSATPRMRMFGMPTGFIANPLGLDDEDERDPRLYGLLPLDTGGPLQLAMGYDNPLLDPARPGAPGGVGYYRIYSQYEVLSSSTTSLCLNLQAYAPAGVQFNGLQNGPAILSPSFGWFHDLGAGTALQGFVSQNFKTASEYSPLQDLKTRTFYGVAMQCPVPRLDGGTATNFFFFVEALGTMRYDVEGAEGPRPALQFLPGIQYRVNDNCWLSLGGTRNGLISCSWKF